jgi:Trp operon repressor
MTSTVLIQNLKAKIVDLSQDELEDEFELYKSLQARSVRDEIYQELLAQELDQREHEQEYA